MKITANQYAESLYEAIAEKSQKEIDEAVLNLTKILQKNRQIKLAPKIYRKFGEIWNQERGIIEAEITSREELHTELRNKVSKYVKEKYLAKEVVLHNIVDEKIQGGIIIRVGDEILNGSVKKQLAVLKNILINQ
ncbi:MAG: ATP synthase F1 subunit delta [Candidatus Moranbacteria bacterium CG_4_9_14_3_um_filter_40_7]|nr:MAG: ATP synthase F1 subunit delta [Candidatus Moranbacteria bacterium CG23_combo_of_CG06-09_8_20_14_all_40_16]PIU80594.1 MAG: ATP synthase F1 subunit delta [Candidatus Moranbacteria bacterium CG06_land_8_20_14_3_00_40_12]PJA88187.1 MAG: ATP synthase F1 subunit delta [Candidatus Moranbacteria bacterium CG_4_9_14_3_um_filter_40_7]